MCRVVFNLMISYQSMNVFMWAECWRSHVRTKKMEGRILLPSVFLKQRGILAGLQVLFQQDMCLLYTHTSCVVSPVSINLHCLKWLFHLCWGIGIPYIFSTSMKKSRQHSGAWKVQGACGNGNFQCQVSLCAFGYSSWAPLVAPANQTSASHWYAQTDTLGTETRSPRALV